jgi:transcriptional regulator with XRE-family HTH domain
MILNLERLGDQLAILRNSQAVTQRQLAARVGTRQNVISPIETGASEPTLATLVALLSGLHCHLEIVPDAEGCAGHVWPRVSVAAPYASEVQ